MVEKVAEVAKPQNTETSNDTKTIVTVILLIFFFPIGFILMWAWTNWPKWVKVLISALTAGFFLLMIVLFGVLIAAFIAMVNPRAQLEKAKQMQQYETTPTPSPTVTNDETQNWKTYTNSTYSYSFKYPSNWSILDKTKAYQSLDAQIFNYSPGNCFIKGCVELVLYNQLDTRKIQLPTGDAGMSSTVNQVLKQTIDGHEVIKVERKYSELNFQTNKWEDSETQYLVYIPIENHYLLIRGDITLKQTLDQILSTFKFTK